MMLKQKEIRAASTRDLLDWLCYACWREYDAACKTSEAAQKRKEKEISWMKNELEKRTKK